MNDRAVSPVELRGRGWQAFDEPVSRTAVQTVSRLTIWPEAPPVDDGRGFISLFQFFAVHRAAIIPRPPEKPAEPELEEEPEPQSLVLEKMVEFQASLPDKLDIHKEVA